MVEVTQWGFQLHSATSAVNLPLSICRSDIPTLGAGSIITLDASCQFCKKSCLPSSRSITTRNTTLFRCKHLDWRLTDRNSVMSVLWSSPISWTKIDPGQVNHLILVHGIISKMKAENEKAKT